MVWRPQPQIRSDVIVGNRLWAVSNSGKKRTPGPQVMGDLKVKNTKGHTGTDSANIGTFAEH